MQVPFSLVISLCTASYIIKTSLVYAMTDCLLPANSLPEFVNMSAPEKCKLSWHEFDRNVHQFYNDLYHSDISDANSEFLSNDEYIMYLDFS